MPLSAISTQSFAVPAVGSHGQGNASNGVLQEDRPLVRSDAFARACTDAEAAFDSTLARAVPHRQSHAQEEATTNAEVPKSKSAKLRDSNCSSQNGYGLGF